MLQRYRKFCIDEIVKDFKTGVEYKVVEIIDDVVSLGYVGYRAIYFDETRQGFCTSPKLFTAEYVLGYYYSLKNGKRDSILISSHKPLEYYIQLCKIIRQTIGKDLMQYLAPCVINNYFIRCYNLRFTTDCLAVPAGYTEQAINAIINMDKQETLANVNTKNIIVIIKSEYNYFTPDDFNELMKYTINSDVRTRSYKRKLAKLIIKIGLYNKNVKIYPVQYSQTVYSHDIDFAYKINSMLANAGILKPDTFNIQEIYPVSLLKYYYRKKIISKQDLLGHCYADRYFSISALKWFKKLKLPEASVFRDFYFTGDYKSFKILAKHNMTDDDILIVYSTIRSKKLRISMLKYIIYNKPRLVKHCDIQWEYEINCLIKHVHDKFELLLLLIEFGKTSTNKHIASLAGLAIPQYYIDYLFTMDVFNRHCNIRVFPSPEMVEIMINNNMDRYVFAYLVNNRYKFTDEQVIRLLYLYEAEPIWFGRLLVDIDLLASNVIQNAGLSLMNIKFIMKHCTVYDDDKRIMLEYLQGLQDTPETKNWYFKNLITSLESI